MEKETKFKTKRDVTHIEIVWDDRQDLIELSTTDLFSNFILEKSYDAITKAIDEGLDKVELFNVFNLSIIIELEKTNFSSVLERIKDLYISQENYEECIKINNLIDKI